MDRLVENKAAGKADVALADAATSRRGPGSRRPAAAM